MQHETDTTDVELVEEFIRAHGEDHLFVPGKGWFFWQKDDGRRRIHHQLASMDQAPAYERIRAITRLLQTDRRMGLASRAHDRAIPPMPDLVQFSQAIFWDR